MVHPPQQIHDIFATNLISQIGFQGSFWQYRVKLFLIILGQLFIVSQFGLVINRIQSIISEILDFKGIRKGRVFV